MFERKSPPYCEPRCCHTLPLRASKILVFYNFIGTFKALYHPSDSYCGNSGISIAKEYLGETFIVIFAERGDSLLSLQENLSYQI